MAGRFADVVEEVKKLPLREKQELKDWLDKHLLEERRDEIRRNHLESLRELRRGEPQFSSDVEQLRERLEE